jgi:uncharacterized protein (DUF1330 family)
MPKSTILRGICGGYDASAWRPEADYAPADSPDILAAGRCHERITNRMTPLESAVTVPAYFVATVEVHDPAGFQPYHEQFQATLAPFAGRLVSFGSAIVPLEGMDGSTAKAAIVVFPSLQAARDWFESPAYRKIAPFRQRSARTRGFFVEGLPCRSHEAGGSDSSPA